MRIQWKAVAVTFVSILGTAGSAAALEIKGSDRLQEMTHAILDACPSAFGISFVGGGDEAAEAAMLAGSQLVAPMSRFMGAAICSAPRPDRAAGTLVALDAAVIMGAQATAGQCGGLRFSGSIPVGSETYTFSNWRDVLRVLFAGTHHDGTIDCNSAVRRALADNWANVFEGTCTGTACTKVQRLFRSSDASEVTELFLSLLSLPATAQNPNVFCNGTERDDNDPIRRPCLTSEQVCSKAGHLGLVVPIVSTTFLAQGDAYPVAPCTGQMVFASASRVLTVVGRCPNGDAAIFGDRCLVPADANGKPACLASRFQRPAFVFDNTPRDGVYPTQADGRVYNLALRTPGGTFRRDPLSRPIDSAFYRIHSNPGPSCTEQKEDRQIGCLAHANPCSLGFGGYAATSAAGAAGIDVNGFAPTTANIRRLISGAGPAWPFARPIYLNTVAGFAGVQSDPLQRAFYTCFSNSEIVETAAAGAGLVPLDGSPFCQDFDEKAICGAAQNRQACGVTINICPGIDLFDVGPLETGIGGTISLAGAASDDDEGPLPLAYQWSATTGTIASPSSPSTTFTCTVPGPVTLTLTVSDGDCGDTLTMPATCRAP